MTLLERTMTSYLLNDESFAALRAVGDQVRTPGALKREPISDAFFMALQQTRIVLAVPAEDQHLDVAAHAVLPAEERYWFMSQESVGALAHLSSQLARTPLTQAFRISFAAKLGSELGAAIRIDETEAERLHDADRERARP